MIRPTRATPEGRAYLELQNLARREGKVTGELLTMYVVERWLARLALSPYRNDFILKGGMLLASLGARRTTADADALARNMAADEHAVSERVVAIASIAMPEDGVQFDTRSVRAQQIREEAVYAGTRIRMNAHVATADVRLSLDINFGDPVIPGPQDPRTPGPTTSITTNRHGSHRHSRLSHRDGHRREAHDSCGARCHQHQSP